MSKFRSSPPLRLVCIVAVFTTAAAHTQVQNTGSELATAIQAAIDASVAISGGPSVPGDELASLYAPRRYTAAWLDSAGRPDVVATEALAILGGSADDGLDPADYDADRLTRHASRLRDPNSRVDVAQAARFDVDLSASVLRYLRHLHLGRVDPRAIGFTLAVRPDRHDFVAILRSALASGSVADAVSQVKPAMSQYDALRTALRLYRALASDRSLKPPAAPAVTVHPGERYPDAAQLQRWLVALRDMSESAPVVRSGLYDVALADGVRHFQRRHGIAVDGVLGNRTVAALRVPLSTRVRQIELALERMRWLPDFGSQPLIAINIPMFRLWAWDVTPRDPRPAIAMDVIVGRALSTQTPVLLEEMNEVVFRPYWNVPRSILRQEVLPRMARDGDYLRAQQMEIVRGAGDDARPVEATAENVELLRRGVLRLRQRPGPRNSLGLVKFVFPNDENVYMHGTPAQALFSRSRRDFSHGCVRVEDPTSLAEWVLSATPGWTRERIVEAMNGTVSLHVPLGRQIQVVLFYATAAVVPEDGGSLRFAEDIYRHDERLDRALAHATATDAARTTDQPDSSVLR